MTPFDTLAPQWVRALMAEFGLTAEQAAGILGNLGYESNGFKSLQEIAPVGGRGGLGAAQWTASRRRAFEAYCSEHRLSTTSDEANYGYLVEELGTTQAHALDRLKMTGSLETAVFTFGYHFEKPGGTTPTHLPGFDGRLSFARRALAGASPAPTPVPPETPEMRMLNDIWAWLKSSGQSRDAKLDAILANQETIMAVMDDLEAKVAKLETTEASAITLLQGLSQALKDAIAAGDMSRVQAVVDKLDADDTKLAAAVTANTPAA